jgi:Na+-transporting NADH:ubiquinone oxidoreductase subunit B
MVALATAFAVVIAKEAFGGTGMNILNVALTARVFLFFAYPTYISGDYCWVAYDYNWLHQIFGGFLHANENLALVDGFSGATPLALAAKGGWEAVTAQYSFSDILYGFIPGSIGEMNKIAVIIGALMLIAIGIGSWRIMLSMVLGAIATGIIFNMFAVNPFMSVPYYYHIFLGSFLFAMAFMATDPVTASTTNAGKWAYGFLIGVVGMIIRVLNPAYPEGWMLAILILNVFAPLIDYYVLDANINRRLSRANQ